MTEAALAPSKWVDVFIGGAGISGIGAAVHIQQQCQGKSWMIADVKETHGGTWHTHTYPGIRSDSDLHTFGYRFKPWGGKPIAAAPLILDYMQEVIKDHNLAPHIHYGQKILSASWISAEQHWHVLLEEAKSGKQQIVAARHFWSGLGYYDHNTPFQPKWPGMDQFKGRLVHPQHWPDDLDYKGKKVVVIGSGATAATVIPNMAQNGADHVTMLQRSPTYFFAGKNSNIVADLMRALRLPETWVHHFTRWYILNFQKLTQRLAERNPKWMKGVLKKGIKDYVSEEMIKEHFTPSYRPWRQRIAFVPDADLFKAIKSGKVSVVTDHIETFTETGIRTKSGKELDADLIVSATGFDLQLFGGIALDIDGEPVDGHELITHRGIMCSGLPNFAFYFGYFRTSWTMRVDMIADYLCGLLNHMDKMGAVVATPTLRPEDQGMPLKPFVSDEEFNPGYIKRSIHKMPQQGSHDPWRFDADYYREKRDLKRATLTDGSLIFESANRKVQAAE